MEESMKSTRVSIFAAAATVAMLCASALPSTAVTITPGGPQALVGLGSHVLASSPSTAGIAYDQQWFFNILTPSLVSANADVSNSSQSLQPIFLEIWRDAATIGVRNIGPGGDTFIQGISAAQSSLLGDLLNVILTAPGDYYVRIHSNGFGAQSSADVSGNLTLSQVPLPPAVILFGTALVGLGVLSRRRRKAIA